jgi:hypothetical protein
MAFLERDGVAYADAAQARQAAGGDHNRRETPLFAASVARRARSRAREAAL